MIDAADREKIEPSRNELHNLLDKPQLQGIPVSMEYLLFHIHVTKLYVCNCHDIIKIIQLVTYVWYR